MPVFRDAVSDTTTTTGTGTITLAGSTAVAGTRTISSAHSNADTLYYRIENSDNTEWEVGLGTYTSSGTTLSRDTILASSNSGSAVNFSAGTKNVYTVIPASFRARGTITANDPFEYTQTWNAAGVTFTALRVNITETAANSASLLIDLQRGGTSQFRVDRGGAITTASRFITGSGGAFDLISNQVRFTSVGAGTTYGAATASGLIVMSDKSLAFADNAGDPSAPDIFLRRDAANTLAQRNGTNAQTFRIYNTYTDASNYERGFFRYVSNTLEIGHEGGGTGNAGRSIKLMTAGFAPVTIASNEMTMAVPTLHSTQYIQFTERTAPSAPSTNNVRIYAEDNGSGSTRLMALFPTGNAQQLASEAVQKRTIWIPASAMIARTTNGAAQGLTEMSTNKNMVATYDFDTSTVEYVQFEVGFPKSWNEGTVTFQASWSHASTTTNFGVAWGLAGVAQSDDDTLDVAFGTEVVVTDTGGTTNDRYRTGESAAVTIAGTPAEGDVVLFQLSRVTGDAGDTMAIDARLHGVWVYFNTNAMTDD